jgi:hypothetical protein
VGQYLIIRTLLLGDSCPTAGFTTIVIDLGDDTSLDLLDESAFVVSLVPASLVVPFDDLPPATLLVFVGDFNDKSVSVLLDFAFLVSDTEDDDFLLFFTLDDMLAMDSL